MSVYSIAPTVSIPAHQRVRPQPRVVSVRAAAPAGDRPALRLTRRGRAVAAAIITVIAMLAAVMLATTSAATRDAAPAQQTEVIVVDSGQTLWGIAAELAPDGETRAMVREIKRLNALESGLLYAGQRINVPVK